MDVPDLVSLETVMLRKVEIAMQAHFPELSMMNLSAEDAYRMEENNYRRQHKGEYERYAGSFSGARRPF